MQQPVSDSPPPASFGALLRAGRHRACLSQEQLAARAELSERTVRNLEADRVLSPRTDTVRLLAGALQLSEPERQSWFEAARGDLPETAVQARAGRPERDAGDPRWRRADQRGRAGAGAAAPRNRRFREAVQILKRAAASFAAAAPRPLCAGHENQPDAGEGEHDAHLP